MGSIGGLAGSGWVRVSGRVGGPLSRTALTSGGGVACDTENLAKPHSPPDTEVMLRCSACQAPVGQLPTDHALFASFMRTVQAVRMKHAPPPVNACLPNNDQ
eukprot:1156372-Pelagomonas_calceolata.AAC.8